nr:substrate-binding domain-containing protein [Planosporangium thailandense]
MKLVGALVDAAFTVIGVRRLRLRAERVLRLAGRKINPWVRRHWRRWLTLPFPGGVPFWQRALGATLTVALVAVVAVRSQRTDLAAFTGCPEPSEVRILTSTDSQQWAQGVFSAYARSTATGTRPGGGGADDRCPTVHPLVYSAPTKLVASALAAGWTTSADQNPVRDIGPRPDLWLPDASVDVGAVLALARKSGYDLPVPTVVAGQDGRVDVAPGSIASIGSSPIVIAGRTPPSGPAQSTLSWSQALATAFDAGTGIVAPDPDNSTTGLFATVSYLLGEHELVGPAQARRRVQIVTDSTAIPGADSVATLCQAGHDAEATVVITSDQLWRLYSAAGALGSSCAGGRPDFAAWSAARPGDGPVLDHPLVEPTWTWNDPTQRAAAQSIRNWLSDPQGRDALAKVDLGPPVDCLATAPTFVSTRCLRVDPQAAVRLYEAAKAPGRVLMAMDASGSMDDPVGTAGGSRFTVAGAGFAQALGQIGAQDELGLWTFPGGAGPYRQLLGIGAGTPAHRGAAVDALRSVKPAGDTPLYRTIVDGLRAVAGSDTGSRTTALVVLTDGQDTSSGMTLQQTRDTVEALNKATGVRLFVVAIGEAACEGAQGLSALTDGHGGCLDADLDHISGTMAQLFESLWKGQ